MKFERLFETNDKELAMYLQENGYKLVSGDLQHFPVVFKIVNNSMLLRHIQLFNVRQEIRSKGFLHSQLRRLLKTELTNLGLWCKKIDVEQIRQYLRENIGKRWHPFTKMLKDELSGFGYWQNKPRGNPKLGYKKGFGRRKSE